MAYNQKQIRSAFKELVRWESRRLNIEVRCHIGNRDGSYPGPVDEVLKANLEPLSPLAALLQEEVKKVNNGDYCRKEDIEGEFPLKHWWGNG